MCLAALALAPHPRLALVLVANRDEFHARPALPLAAWPAPQRPALMLYAGRDAQAGGTWLGLSASGRVGLLTNVRRTAPVPADAPTRGELVTAWLTDSAPAPVFWPAWQARGHAPFNLLMGDLASGAWFWGSNVGGAGDGPQQQWLHPGQVHGLSNAALDTPWPKLQTLRAALAEALHEGLEPQDSPALQARLWQALADRTRAPDAQLPDTGFGLERERMLSSIFIDDGRGVYGTRCSTLLWVERPEEPGEPLLAHLTERRFGPDGALLGEVALSVPLVGAQP